MVEDTEMFIALLKNIESNKYKLIQIVLKEGAKLSKINPDFDPFYTGNFIRKIEKSLLKEQEDK